jgi:hypothetical protein
LKDLALKIRELARLRLQRLLPPPIVLEHVENGVGRFRRSGAIVLAHVSCVVMDLVTAIGEHATPGFRFRP